MSSDCCAPRCACCIQLVAAHDSCIDYGVHSGNSGLWCCGELDEEDGELNLSERGIVSVRDLGSLECAAQIKAVNLGHNELATLPASLFRGTNVETVILEHNELKSLPAALLPSTGLKEVTLYGNHFKPKFDCCFVDPASKEDRHESGHDCESIAPSCTALAEALPGGHKEL